MDIKLGVWEKKSKAGNKYYGGKGKVEGTEYWITVFDNRENKKNPKAPDFNIILKQIEDTETIDAINDEEIPF